MAQLFNRADVVGTFDGVLVDNFTELTVELSALNITKRADKAIWVRDELEYTIEVSNIDNAATGLPVTGVVITDTIDPTIATLVAGSVEIDGSIATEPDDYTFNPATGLLTISFASIAAGGSHTITFRVEMV